MYTHEGCGGEVSYYPERNAADCKQCGAKGAGLLRDNKTTVKIFTDEEIKDTQEKLKLIENLRPEIPG
jgi:hypothetical protein